jgi:hypothetical protein
MRLSSLLRRPAVSLVSVALLAGCGKSVVRGSNEPGIDSAAMSTGLDKTDIQRMLKEALDDLRTAPVMGEWRQKGGHEVVTVFPFRNETSEHIDPQLQAILSETETWLIDSQVVTVVSRERQNEIIADVEGQRNAVFNPGNVARYGRQLGARYYVTGKVQAADERLEGERRVQYFLFLQVIELETGAIKWQHKSYVTKLLR